MSMKTKVLLEKALIRALWTMAEVALSYLTIGMTITEVDWLHLASVTALAGIISLLKSMAVGLPEVADIEVDAHEDTE